MNKSTTDKIEAIRRRIENAQTQTHPSKALVEGLKARLEVLNAFEEPEAKIEGLNAEPKDEQECYYIEANSYVRLGYGKRGIEILSKEEVLEKLPPKLCDEVKERWLDTPDMYVRRYKKTDNALYLWEAIRRLMMVNAPLPAEVRSYLAECAKGLLGGVECKQAMKLNKRGHGGMLKRTHQHMEEMSALIAYYNKLEGFETQEESAKTLGIGSRWFSRILKKHKRS